MTINDIITAAWLELPAGGPIRGCSAHRVEAWMGHDLPSWLAGPGFAACRISPDGPCYAQFSLRIDENGMWHFTRSNIGQEAYSRLHAAWPGLKGGEEAAPRRKRPGRVFDGAWLISEQWPRDGSPGDEFIHRAQSLIHLTFTGKGRARRPAWVLDSGGGMAEGWRNRRPKASAEYEDLAVDGGHVERKYGSRLALDAVRETPGAEAMAALRDHVAKRRLAAL